MSLEGFTTELMQPITKEGMRSAIRSLHACIAEDKPLKGMYKEYLLKALDEIAKGGRPDTAFGWRSHEIGPSRQTDIMKAMEEIYHRNLKGTKITKIIEDVCQELGFGYETLKKEWYKDQCTWKKAWDEHYKLQYQYYEEYPKKL